MNKKPNRLPSRLKPRPGVRPRVGAMSNPLVRMVPLLGILLLALVAYNTAVAVLVALGIVPTLVMAFTATGRQAAAKTQVILLCNIAGILMAVHNILAQGARASLLDVNQLAVAYAAAAMGYVLIFVGPIVAALVLQTLAQDRLRGLMKQRQTLIDQWGPELLGQTAPPPGTAPAQAANGDNRNGKGGGIIG